MRRKPDQKHPKSHPKKKKKKIFHGLIDLVYCSTFTGPLCDWVILEHLRDCYWTLVRQILCWHVATLTGLWRAKRFNRQTAKHKHTRKKKKNRVHFIHKIKIYSVRFFENYKEKKARGEKLKSFEESVLAYQNETTYAYRPSMNQTGKA